MNALTNAKRIHVRGNKKISTLDLSKCKRLYEFEWTEGVLKTVKWGKPKKLTFLNVNGLDSNTQLIGNYPFDKIYSIVKNVLEDGIISNNEYDELMRVFNDFIDPINEEKMNDNLDFQDKIFCLTGTFNSGSKDSIEEKIVNKGGICSKGVTSKTNYLIVGGSGSDAWKFGNYGGKVQKAMELKEKGKNIEIISEEDFLKQL